MQKQYEYQFPFAYLLGISEQDHFWILFSLGEDYLKTYCGQFTADIQIYMELPEFWIFFKQLAMQADMARFINLDMNYILANSLRPDKNEMYFNMIASHDSLVIVPNRIVEDAYKRRYKTIGKTQLTQTI